MNRWLKRALLVYTIGGGFLGVVLSCSLFAQAKPPLALPAALVVLFAVGIIAGIMLAEGAPRAGNAMRCFLALQIPVLTSPLLGWHMISAAGVNVVWSPMGWGFWARFGSEVQLSIAQELPFSIGVNLVPLALLLLVLWSERRQRQQAASG